MSLVATLQFSCGIWGHLPKSSIILEFPNSVYYLLFVKVYIVYVLSTTTLLWTLPLFYTSFHLFQFHFLHINCRPFFHKIFFTFLITIFCIQSLLKIKNKPYKRICIYMHKLSVIFLFKHLTYFKTPLQDFISYFV